MGSKMWKRAIPLVLAGMLASVLAPNAIAADKKSSPQNPAPMKLKVGDMAPNFTLLAFNGHDLKKISLSDYRGKKDVVLAFYVFAFTGG